MFAIISNQAAAQTEPCSFSYAQGFAVGKALGQAETHPDENKNVFVATLNTYSHCSLYIAGVMEGYYIYRKTTGITVGGGGGGSCSDGTIFTSDPCNKDDVVGGGTGGNKQ